MNFHDLSHHDLDQKIRTCFKREQENLSHFLIILREMDTRRSYLELGFSNMFLYLTEGVGYSNGVAQRRIDAARLSREIPEVMDKIKAGEVSLNQITLVQKAAREVFKRSSRKVSAVDKKQILNEIKNASSHEAEQRVAAFFDVPVVKPTLQKAQADKSVRVELTLSKELAAEIRQAQELLSHSLADGDLVTYLKYVTGRVIKHKTSVRKKTGTPSSGPAKVDFSARDRKIILNEEASCRFVDPITQKKCGARWHAQVDHRQSKWSGGRAEISNGQTLCRAHNQNKYRKETGTQFRS